MDLILEFILAIAFALLGAVVALLVGASGQ
jgi:hypothetical protein